MTLDVNGCLVYGGCGGLPSGGVCWCGMVGGGPPLHFFFSSMVINNDACGNSIQARFQALKGELRHLVLSFSKDFNVQDGDSFTSMAYLGDLVSVSWAKFQERPFNSRVHSKGCIARNMMLTLRS